jgi:hypothetical protein
MANYPSDIGGFVIGESPIGGQFLQSLQVFIPTGQTNATVVLPSYLYWQYSDDENLQAFVASYNQIAQGYLDWFNATPLALYTSPGISGALLDWTAYGLRGIARPTVGNTTTFSIGAINTFVVNELPVNAVQQYTSGYAFLLNDDYYKRVLTWWFYRGDGRNMSIDWIRRRVTRFIYGVNGADVAYPSANPPSVKISYFGGVAAIDTFTVNTVPVGASYAPGTSNVEEAGIITITVPNNTTGAVLQYLIANNYLLLPFATQFKVVLEGTSGIQIATTFLGAAVLAGGLEVEIGVP